MSSASASKRSGSARTKGTGPGRRPTKTPTGRRSGPIKQPWLVYGVLGAAAIALIVLAITTLGAPTTSSGRTETETVTAADGVVQSTASGSGNVSAGIDDEVSFQTSGTLEHVYVKQGETVKKGQLLAKLNPSTAELALESDEATLAQAEDTLTTAEDNETTTDSTAEDDVSSDTTVFAAYRPAAESTATTTTPTPAVTTTAVTPTATTPTPTATTPAATSAGSGNTSTNSGTTRTGATGTGATKVVTVTVTSTTPTSSSTSGSGSSGSYSGAGTGSSSSSGSSDTSSGSSSSGASTSSGASSGSSGTSSTDTAATVAADKVQVETDEDTVAAAKKAVRQTKLYAPVAGVIATLSSDSIGTTEGSSSSSADSSTSSATSATASTGSSQAAGSLGGSSTTSSSSSGFAEIVNTNTLTMTVAFSEADINEIKVGQPATVTISALTGVELAGKITAISPVGTTSDDVVSYDATITIDQTNAKVKSGMTATAAVVIDSESGVTVPTDAVSGGSVELIKDGKTTSTPVTVGLTGTSREIITSGVASGDELKVTETLPSLGASTSTTSSSSGTSGTSGFTRSGAGGFAGGAGFSGGGFGGGAPGAG